MEDKIKVGQVWRKLGGYDWVRIEEIQDPEYGSHDGGCHGCVIRSFPPQLKGIQLRGGKKFFVSDNQENTWEEQIRMNRFILEEGWKRGDMVHFK